MTNLNILENPDARDMAAMLIGQTHIEVAFDSEGDWKSACFADNFRFGEWAKLMVETGHEVRTMTLPDFLAINR